MRTRATLFFVLSLALLFSSCCCVGGAGSDGERYKNEFEKSYAVRAPARVIVSNIDGFVHVDSWDRNEVSVKGAVSLKAKNEKEAQKLMKEINVIITHEDQLVSVKVERKKRQGLSQLFHLPSDWRVDLQLMVPKECDVSASSVDGALRASGLKGTHKLSTVDGAIEARDIDGRVECRTVDGSCYLSNVRGTVEARTTDGGIRIDGILTGLKASTVDGSIRVAALEGSAVAEKWRISGVSGSINLAVPGSMSADLDARTVDGHISIDVPSLVGTISQRKVSAKLGKGGNPVSISTTDGSISVKLIDAKKEEA